MPIRPGVWTLIWTPLRPVSCVSCVSWMYSVNAAETYETDHWESGMRYQVSSTKANSCSKSNQYLACAVSARTLIRTLIRDRFMSVVSSREVRCRRREPELTHPHSRLRPRSRRWPRVSRGICSVRTNSMARMRMNATSRSNCAPPGSPTGHGAGVIGRQGIVAKRTVTRAPGVKRPPVARPAHDTISRQPDG